MQKRVIFTVAVSPDCSRRAAHSILLAVSQQLCCAVLFAVCSCSSFLHPPSHIVETSSDSTLRGISPPILLYVLLLLCVTLNIYIYIYIYFFFHTRNMSCYFGTTFIPPVCRCRFTNIIHSVLPTAGPFTHASCFALDEYMW
jgi:hypothetical protein